MASVLCATGRFSAGRKQLRAALEIDPLSPMIGKQLGVDYYIERCYADAFREFTNVVDLNPHFWTACHFSGLCHEAMGCQEAHLSTRQKTVASAPRYRRH